ncbi:cadmium resistance transporter [Paraburkholderia megapolitana]|uniref:Cadmium resistance protein CadD, predicted permease n=1 Tax=Paraburkholderia megapolitana TaxID=420953 RepID=A0A1I3W605_9BURK|nr:cadmium resistance transporter [Paraburkholderia megapolitana]QDQ84610.1 cadmium transporter [Paraburkholderia megapolitana]SFK02107.1 Cadmium resistance protein CadD, predicted permease [Paraburkholderia megapolitana]
MTSLVILAVAAYAATNIDNLCVLLAFLADARDGKYRVIVGQFLGSAALVVIALAVAALLTKLPEPYIGLLGFLPVTVGIVKGRTWLRSRSGVEQAEVASASRGSSPWTVAGVAISNGSDNLAVYVPLYAAHSAADAVTITLVFAAMTALWCASAVWLVNHPLLGAPLRRYGAAILPLVLIVIGISVIVQHEAWRVVIG